MANPIATTTVLLNDGRRIPQLGLGVYKAGVQECYQAILWALQAGYRHIDTAAVYGNEESVGRAVRDSGVPRADVWITTKLWNTDQGYESAKAALDTSLRKLGTDYVDLYLLHAPVRGKRLDSWRALTELQRAGKARSIGVSNFGEHHLEELARASDVVPAVNQVEIHPFNARTSLCAHCAKKGIVMQAYCPLTRGAKLQDQRIAALASKYGVTPAQILIRWSIEHGYVVLPKSVNKERIHANADVFSFSISAQDMATLDGLEEHFVVAWDPTRDP